MHDAKIDLLSRQVSAGLSSKKLSEEEAEMALLLNHTALNDFELQCDCLQACTSLQYNAELSQANFDWPSLFQAFKANMSEFPG